VRSAIGRVGAAPSPVSRAPLLLTTHLAVVGLMSVGLKDLVRQMLIDDRVQDGPP
jgi:hypothetical protein